MYVNKDGVPPMVASPSGHVGTVWGVEVLGGALNLLYGGEAVVGVVVERVVVYARGVVMVVGLV